MATPPFGLHLVPIRSAITENRKSRKCSVDTQTTCLGSIPNVHNCDRCSLQPAKASPVKHCRSPLLPTPRSLRGEGSELPPSEATVPRRGRACWKRGSPRRSRRAGRGRASSQGSVRGETAPEGGEEPRAPRRRLTSAKDPHGELKARWPRLQRPVRGPWGAQGGPAGAPPLPPGRPRLPLRPRGASVLRQPGRTGAAGGAGVRTGGAAAGAWRGRPGRRRGREAAGRRYLRSRAESPSQPRRLLNPTTQDGGCAATQRHVRGKPRPPGPPWDPDEQRRFPSTPV